MAGAYRVSLATPAGMAHELLRLARYGLATEELDRIAERVLALRREDVVEAGRRHIDPERLCLAVAGDLVAKASVAD
jgi:predicted Zn-dependent peptidase